MNFKLLFVSVSIILSGCTSNPFSIDSSKVDDSSPINSYINESDTSNINDLDASYLQIAKDLFVAGQYKQAYQISSNLAAKNNVEAQYLLGYMIYYGYGAPADIIQGTKWISASADTGYRPAIEALVLIKHGLTPDNKCSSVNLLPDTKTASNTQVASEPDINKNKISKSELVSSELKAGEVLITPQQKNSVAKKNPDYIKSDKVWNYFTIQLMSGDSKSSIIDFRKEFINKYPDLSDNVISYKSKNKPYSYGIGFSTFKTNEDALIVLNNIEKRINNSSLLVRHLDKFEPIVIKN